MYGSSLRNASLIKPWKGVGGGGGAYWAWTFPAAHNATAPRSSLWFVLDISGLGFVFWLMVRFDFDGVRVVFMFGSKAIAMDWSGASIYGGRVCNFWLIGFAMRVFLQEGDQMLA